MIIHAIPVDLAVVAALIMVAMLQSVFGVGVLLFGTPLMLLLGHDFADVLALLLPISIAISLSQVAMQRAAVERRFLLRVMGCAVPAIVGALFLALQSSLNLGLAVAAIMLVCGMGSLWSRLDPCLGRLARHEVPALIVTGLVHGISNLGGSLLSVIVQQKRLGKDATRATIAAAYAVFASCQLGTLAFTRGGVVDALAGNAKFVAVGVMVYAATNALVYRRLDGQRYAQAFAIFLVLSGVTLGLRSI
jgi:uncharacterized protein